MKDTTSPKTQRRVWRRVWIGLALFVIVTPMLAWVFIDQAGKAEWKRVEEKLRSVGEVTSFSEWDIPTHGEIPDEENFGALPWLAFDEQITKAQHPEAPRVELALRTFSSFGFSLSSVGFSTNLANVASRLDKRADQEREDSRTVIQPKPAKNLTNPVVRVSEYLSFADPIWDDLEAARNRPHAYFLPFALDRKTPYEAGRTGANFMYGGATALSIYLPSALSVRILHALEIGDLERAIRSLEVAQRFGEACGHEMGVDRLESLVFTPAINVFVECLAHPEWQQDPQLLLRSQRLFEKWPIGEHYARIARIETIHRIEEMHWLRDHRSEALEKFSDVESNSLWLRVAPNGWFDNNAAFLAETIDDVYFSQLRSGHYHKLLDSETERLSAVNSLSSLQRDGYGPAIALLESGGGLYYAEKRLVVAETRRRQAILACAIYRYRLESAQGFPSQLAELVPEYLDEIPADPLDGKPMRYQLAPDDEGGFRLWSIGPDLTDDGGSITHRPEGPRSTAANLFDKRYIGDWPWPVVLKQLPAAEKTDEPDE